MKLKILAAIITSILLVIAIVKHDQWAMIFWVVNFFGWLILLELEVRSDNSRVMIVEVTKKKGGVKKNV